MVGLVLVSHSPDLVRGLRDLLAQMDPDVPVAIAGGTDEGAIGTSLELITAALDDADRGDGAIVLYDLGSAEMTADAALEFLDDERRARCLLVDAPLVEGALAALGRAGGGADVAEVAAAARSVCAPPPDAADRAGDGSHDTTGTSDEATGTSDEATGSADAPADATDSAEQRATLLLRNTQGLHARPAAQIVRAVRRLDAQVKVERADGGQRANAASALALVGLGATAGTTVVVRATGPEAAQAVARVRTLIEDGFGEPLDPAADAQRATEGASGADAASDHDEPAAPSA